MVHRTKKAKIFFELVDKTLSASHCYCSLCNNSEASTHQVSLQSSRNIVRFPNQIEIQNKNTVPEVHDGPSEWLWECSMVDSCKERLLLLALLRLRCCRVVVTWEIVILVTNGIQEPTQYGIDNESPMYHHKGDIFRNFFYVSTSSHITDNHSVADLASVDDN